MLPLFVNESCLADYFTGKIAEVSAAKGDLKKLFGRPRSTPQPNADAVDLCVAQIHSTNSCLDFIAVDRVFQIDSDVSEKNAEVIAEVEMAVLAPFTACSPIASSCTGTCWDLTSNRPKSTPGTRDNFVIGYRLRIEKIVRVSKDRQRQLALQFNHAAAGGARPCPDRTLVPARTSSSRFSALCNFRPAIHRAETVSVHGLLRPVVRFSGWAREISDPLTPANQDRPDE